MQQERELLTILEELNRAKDAPLYQYRKENKYFCVIGEGNVDADVIFIGEAPGEQEARRGVPFCGASGRLLDELLHSISLARGDVYITNIVKDRPPNNRDPFPEEIEYYGPYLLRQLKIIKPKIIVTLGRFSMSWVSKLLRLPEVRGISAVHGKVYSSNASYGPISFIPLYHPATALYNPEKRTTLLEDFNTLRLTLEEFNIR